MKSCCNDCTRSSYCIRQYDEEQRASCPILNADNEPLRYRNSEGYSDPTAFFALRNVMKATKPKKKTKAANKLKGKKKRHPRTQVVHYD